MHLLQQLRRSPQNHPKLQPTSQPQRRMLSRPQQLMQPLPLQQSLPPPQLRSLQALLKWPLPPPLKSHPASQQQSPQQPCRWHRASPAPLRKQPQPSLPP